MGERRVVSCLHFGSDPEHIANIFHIYSQSSGHLMSQLKK